MMDIQIKQKKSEKVWREFCKDCGCPLEICCKPKKPVISVEEIEEAISFIEKTKFKVWKCQEDVDEFEDALAFLRKRLVKKK